MRGMAMPAVPAVTGYDVVMAVHIMGVVIAFGWTFALPVYFIVAAKQDPRSLPTLHRVELTISRYVLNPALVVVLGAGIFLASDGHHWSEFFVQWGLGAIVVLGGLVGAVLMPAAKRAEAAARKELEAYAGGEFKPGPEYGAAVRTLNVWGSLASGLVLVTILFMTIKP
jgi:uncharacterized membrane protein